MSVILITVVGVVYGWGAIAMQDLDSQAELILFIRNTGMKSSSTFAIEPFSGEQRQLAPEGYIATSWSPDGEQILVRFVDENPFIASSIIVMDSDGQKEKILTDNSQLNPYPGIWSSDGTEIYFWARDLTTEEGESSWSIYGVPSSGGIPLQFIELTDRKGGLSLASDGSQFMFNQGNHYHRLSSAGGVPQIIDLPFNASPIYVWSPDDEHIAIVASGEDKRIGVYVFEPDGSNVRLLVSGINESYSIEWSPDGSELLFSAYTSGRSATTVGVVNVETGEIERYDVRDGILEAIKGIRSAIWSPDGSQIAITGVYNKDNPYNAFANIYLIDRDFTSIDRLTNNEHLDGVRDWRPHRN